MSTLNNNLFKLWYAQFFYFIKNMRYIVLCYRPNHILSNFSSYVDYLLYKYFSLN